MSKAALIKSNDFSWTKASKSYHEVLTNFEIKTCNRSGIFGGDIVICGMNRVKKNLASWIVNFASSNLF